jgi:hypothetical protein
MTELYNVYLLSRASHYKDDELAACFKRAWQDDANKSLRLIMYVRDIYQGLGRRNVSYILMRQLKELDPRVYRINLNFFCELYGCYRDVLGIIQEGDDVDIEIGFMKMCLLDDIEALQGGEWISQAGKWAPSEGSKYDMFAKRLANVIFPGCLDAMRRYRKEILVPLREKLDIVERKLCRKEKNINWRKVPILARKKYKHLFEANIISRNVTTQTDKILTEQELFTVLSHYYCWEACRASDISKII